MKSGVTLSAPSAANLVGRQIVVRGGDNAGAARGSGSSITSTRVEMDGAAGTAAYSVATGVSIAGGSSLLIQTNRAMDLRGGSQAGEGIVALIGSSATGATATLGVQAGVSISGDDMNVGTEQGLLTVRGGDSAGFGASLQALAGKLTLSADAGLSFKGGDVHMGQAIFAQDLRLTGGDRAGASAQVQSGPGGVAQLGAHADLTVTASGTISVAGVRGLDIVGGASAAASAFAGKHSGSGGGSAAVTATADVKLAGGSVTLSAFTTSISIAGGDGAAQAAEVDAVAGQKASVNGDASVSVTASTGGITLNGKHDLSLRGGAHAAGGRTTVTTTGPHASNSSSAGTTGTSSGTHSVAAHRTGSVADTQVQATGIGASATITGAAGVSLSAKGAISLVPVSAGGSVLVQGGSSAAASVAGSGMAAKATVTGNAAVSIKAGGALKLGGKVITVKGGRRAAAAAGSYSVDGVSHCHSGAASCFEFVPSPSTSLHQPVQPNKGHSGGQVSVTGDASVSLSGGSVTLTASSDVHISGGALALQSAHAKASSAGVVKLSGKAGVSITSTTGAMKLKAAQDLTIMDGVSGGRSAQAQAIDGGSAALTATTGVKVSAKTSLSLTGDHVTVQPADGILSHASASASGSGAKAAITVDGRTSLKAGTNLSITVQGSVALTTGVDVASSSAPVAHTTGGAVSTVTGKLNLTLTSDKDLIINAPTDTSGDIMITAGDGYSGSSGRVIIGGDTFGGLSLTAGGVITLNGGTNPIISGGGFGVMGSGGTHGAASACVSIGGAGCGGAISGVTITASGGTGIVGSGGAYHPGVMRAPETVVILPMAGQKLGPVRDQALVIHLEALLAADPRTSGKQ